MAESRKFIPTHHLDLGRIVQEAQNRWLRPAEICEILRNYRKFHLAPDPPVRPPAGSLFLFDRKALRYFRKDGHRWRKKKDGKTVKEAHEKLKAGSVDVLHCYYAHGEDNENFQRRSYWMLDGEVKEGYKSGISRVSVDPGSQAGGHQGGTTPVFLQANSPVGSAHTSCPLILRQIVRSENGGVDSSIRHDSVVSSDVNHVLKSSMSPVYLPAGSSVLSEQEFVIIQSGTTDSITHELTDARLAFCGLEKDMVNSEDGLIADADIPAAKAVTQRTVQVVDNSCVKVEKTLKDNLNHEGFGELKKLDSFSRWMDKEIGGDCNDSLMTLDSGNYWCTLNAGNNEKEVSSFSHHMQLDVDSLGPSLSQEQLFSIIEYSPDWTYRGNVTKVLIVGSFLGSKKLSSENQWGCMFGEVEVPAEVLTNNVLRCQAPPLHAPGRIPFYVTCCNRLACSEVREFEYREKPPNLSVPDAITASAPEDEIRLQMRLISLLNLGVEEKWLNCSIQKCEKCQIRSLINSERSNSAKWRMMKGISTALKSEQMTPRDLMIQTLLEDKLCEWLVCKVHEGTRGTHVLDDEGQGVIHLAAALGYEWAIGPLVASGISPNFRDSNGRTALHWASYFGREDTVTTLIRFGAAPGAVDDPTSGFPEGQKAADLASSRGHKGISGYLAEADLAEHLRTLTNGENHVDNVEENVNFDEAIQTADVVSSQMAEDELLSLKSSLAAVRKSVRAAALIHAAFRARSFRHKQLMESDKEMIPEDSLDLVALGILNKAQKIHYEDYLHVAAVRIQQNYRGWKGRKEFLKIRNRIVKIQAHVRGYQVRKQYRKVIWSVSIVEKAILRWRRKRVGLRGFKAEGATGTVVTPHPQVEKSDEYEFLRIGRKLKYAGVEKALSRVKSMARFPEARHQYMRLVAKFDNFKINEEETSASNQGESSQDTHKERHLPQFSAADQ
ncbi:calmodulin-binding transcription activator 3-like isoform X2 [Momordica charantia]|uniref:Calmodulin-binding transcription activator 3-like isoform X2 n=1 Tax=Momordica charantia TaxID=3673 RepID=A0A6J1C7V0_MOMCH|nr:calmodulin-binding transcription activator 3-like isoform X2 [Momordica charantia]